MKLRQPLFPLLCLVVIIASTGFVGFKLARGNAVDTDILSLLPASREDPSLAAALDRLNSVASSRIVVAIDHGTPSVREEAAVDLSNRLTAAGIFQPSADEGVAAWKWLFAHRTTLLCPADRKLLEQGQGAALARDALLRWYSPFAVSDSALAKSDPLLLTPRLMSCFLQPLAGAAPNEATAIVSGRITAPVFATDTQDRLNAVLGDWRLAWSKIPLRVAHAGAVFHADHAAKNARLQMSLISVATGLLILLIYRLVFRSIRPAFLAILLILSCLAFGLAVTFLVFDRIHVMVVVFATALIGMVVDYSTYYLITGIAHPGDSAAARRRSIFQPLTLGMATSVGAFAALLLSPISAFRQVAVLGGVGLFAAWGLALYLLPLLEGRRRVVTPFAAEAQRRVHRALTWTPRPAIAALTVVAVALVTLAAWAWTAPLDDVRRFQVPSAELAAEEAHIRQVTGFAMPSAFFLVTGETADAQKRNEEVLLEALQAAPDQPTVLLAASRLDPSAETAKLQAALLQRNLLEANLQPLLDKLGFNATAAYKAAANADAAMPSVVSALRGQTGVVFWSIVPLAVPAAEVSAPFRSGQAWKLVEPAAEYSELLARYRWNATVGLIGGAVLTGAILLLVYRRLAALWILLPTVLAMLAAPAILALAGVPYSFFSAMALFLVVGAGVDYSIFQWEHRGARGNWTRLGITLAAIMTCTSLGLLGLSSIYPVAAFGLTVALGVLLSLAFSPLVALGFPAERSNA
ncbi:MMPL family transporter [Dongia sp. agr-C8]